MKNFKVFALIHVIGFAFLLLCAGVFSSCKVTLDDDSDLKVNGTVRGEYNDKIREIPDIVVEIIENGSSYKKLTYTDEYGWFEFDDLKAGSYTLRFTDTDGDKNGAFKQHIERLSLYRRDYYFDPIILESADKGKTD